MTLVLVDALEVVPSYGGSCARSQEGSIPSRATHSDLGKERG